MAQKWANGDSARLMTKKYNTTADEVEELKKAQKETNEPTKKELEEFKESVDKKFSEYSNVDNTSDEDKPVSIAQQQALDEVTKNMLTSEPINGIDVGGPEPGVLLEVYNQGTKIFLNTESARVVQKVNVFISNNKIVFLSAN